MKVKSIRKSFILFLLLFVFIAFTPMKALAEGSPYDVTLNETKYSKLEDAVKAAKSGDTIILGEGHYSLYGINSTGHTKGKDLTFVGQGTDKTFWGIGAEVPDPSKFGSEYNGDYSFDGAGKVTFKNMTLQSAVADYLGFIRADHTVVEGCIINGKTFYWGYKSATFTNTVFNAPTRDYALWTYSSPVMTFDSCTFNSSGKTVNVYSDYNANKNDITVNFSNCTVNSSITSTFWTKPVLNINDSNKGSCKFYINLSGKNTIEGTVIRDIAKPTDESHTATCSRWFGFGGKQNTNNTGRTVVTMDGITIFEDGKRVSHEIDTANDKYTDGYKDDAYEVTEWEEKPDVNQYARVKTCQYCGEKVDEKGYKLSYDPNGGIWSDGSNKVLDKDIIKVNQGQKIEKAPVKKGFNFLGWSIEPQPANLYQPEDSYNEQNDSNEFINATLKAVWEPIINTVTFIDGDKDYANVKVENGKSIDDDALTDQFMPQNPTKEGFAFKEWNTEKGGKGDKFTGGTTVDQDMTVYAIYDMNAAVMNEAPILEVKDASIKQGENLDLMSLIVSANDKEDGDLKDKVEITDDGGFSKDIAGEYTVTFKVTDKDGASVIKKATVKVLEKDNSKPGGNNPTSNNDNDKPTVKPGNNKPQEPETGDNSNMLLYVMLLGLSGTSILAAGLRKIRKES